MGTGVGTGVGTGGREWGRGWGGEWAPGHAEFGWPGPPVTKNLCDLGPPFSQILCDRAPLAGLGRSEILPNSVFSCVESSPIQIFT